MSRPSSPRPPPRSRSSRSPARAGSSGRPGTAREAWQAWHGTGDEALSEVGAEGPHRGSSRAAFRRGLLVGALNPKTAVFYLAFLPQFVSPGAGPVWSHMLVFGLLFIALAGLVDAQWAIAGGSLRRLLPRLRMRVVDRASGVVYAALAAVALSARRLALA